MKKGLKINMSKKAQFEMGFSMIFSIIVIIAIIGVSVYVINFFLKIDECGDVGFFYKDLQDEVDKAWRTSIYRGDFADKTPNKIEQVCFGNINDRGNDEISEQIRIKINELVYAVDETNIFLYPLEKACDADLAYNKINHVEIEGFFCIEAENFKLKL